MRLVLGSRGPPYTEYGRLEFMLDTPVRLAVRPSVAAVALTLLVGCSAADSGSSDPTTADDTGAPAHGAEFDRLEEDFDTRLGVYALDTATGEEVNYSSDERFPYTSTFKPLACGAVLATGPWTRSSPSTRKTWSRPPDHRRASRHRYLPEGVV